MEVVRESVIELVAFVNALKMGGFYHTRIAELLTHHEPHVYDLDAPDHVVRKRMSERAARFREKLLKNREAAIALLVELLRYQEWPGPVKSRARAT
jgi:hypothetical protein